MVSHRPSSSAHSASTYPREAARAGGQAPPLGCCPGDRQLHPGLMSVGSSGSPVLPGRCLPPPLSLPLCFLPDFIPCQIFHVMLPAFLHTETDLPWVPPAGGMPCTEDCLEDYQCLTVALGTMLDMKTGFPWAGAAPPLDGASPGVSCRCLDWPSRTIRPPPAVPTPIGSARGRVSSQLGERGCSLATSLGLSSVKGTTIERAWGGRENSELS